MDTPPTDAERLAAGREEAVYADGRDADSDWLTSGLGVALLAAGLVLLLFPEPATSLLGATMMVFGLVAVVVTRYRSG